MVFCGTTKKFDNSQKMVYKTTQISNHSEEGLKPLLQNLNRKMWFSFPDIAISLSTNVCRSENSRVYRRVLEQLLSTNKLSFRMIQDLQRPGKADRIIVGIRHDIDHDITTAFRLAKIEHEYGLRGSYYVLHTAPYYGYYHKKEFYWNKHCIDILLEIQSLGHEIGLHNDCLYNLIHFGILPEESLHTELGYLRSHGVTILGTSSHGSYHTYLASNYEIFEGLSIEGRQAFGDNKGKKHHIGYISMKDFNLEYEANFIVKNWLISSDEYNRTHYPHFICFANNTDMSIRDYNAQYGIFGRNCWIHIDTTKPVLSYVSTRKMLKKIISHHPGERIVLDSHPMYFGYSFKRNILSALARVTELVI